MVKYKFLPYFRHSTNISGTFAMRENTVLRSHGSYKKRICHYFLSKRLAQEEPDT